MTREIRVGMIRVSVGVAAAVLTLGSASAVLGRTLDHGQVTAVPAPAASAQGSTTPDSTGPGSTSPEPTASPEPATTGPARPSGPPRPADRLATTPVPPPAPKTSTITPTTGPPAAQPRQPAAPQRAAGCTTDTRPIQPARFQIPRMGVDVSIITVGKDRDGNPGAPPLSQMFTAAWYEGSPAPNSRRGNVIVNIHSWASGPALGNDVRTKLRTGDEIRVVGTDGRVACYRFREQIKIRVATYDPASGLYQNPTGRPQLAIMTCWDRNPKTGEYESRLLFYADLVR